MRYNIFLIPVFFILISQILFSQSTCPTIGQVLDEGWCHAPRTHLATYPNHDEIGIIHTAPFWVKVGSYPPTKSFPNYCSEHDNYYYYVSFDTEFRGQVIDQPYEVVLYRNQEHEVIVYDEGGVGWKFIIDPPEIDPVDFIMNFDGSLHAEEWGVTTTYEEVVKEILPFYFENAFEDFNFSVEGPKYLAPYERGIYTPNIEGGNGRYQIQWSVGSNVIHASLDAFELDIQALNTKAYYYRDDPTTVTGPYALPYKLTYIMGQNDVEIKVYVLDIISQAEKEVTFTIELAPQTSLQSGNWVNDVWEGDVTVNGKEKESGDIFYAEVGYNNFLTKDIDFIVNSNKYKFRNWSSQSEHFNPSSTIQINSMNQVPALFYKTYPITINNNLEGGTGGYYNITWNTTDQTKEKKSGYAYDAFDYQFNNDKYDIVANSFLSELNTNWYFQNWGNDGAGNTLSQQTFSAPRQYTAYYKGINRSNYANAFSNNSQRKFVITDDGYLHYVYESLDYNQISHVWYQWSSNGGSTWQLIHLNDGAGAKNPSIDNYSNQVVISYQYAPGTSTAGIAVALFRNIEGAYLNEYEDGVYTQRNIIKIENISYSIDVNPVIAFGNCGEATFRPRIILVWEGSDHLYYRGAAQYASSQIQWLGNTNYIPETNSTSNNPTISAKKQSGTPYDFYVAWDQNGSSILFSVFTVTTGIFISSPYTNVSGHNGYSYNYSPSIVAVNISSGNDACLAWVAKRENQSEAGGETPMYDFKAFLKRYTNGTWSTFNSYGDQVNTVSINKNSNNTFALAWTEGTGSTNKFVRSDNLSWVSTLSTSGKYIQVGNYSNLDNMRLITLSTSSLPYNFIFSNRFEGDPDDESSEREGIMQEETTAFFYSLGGIKVDNEAVDFITLPEAINPSTNSELNGYLISEAFQLNNNNNFTFNINYGFTDSAGAVSLLQDDGQIKYSVQLIDVATNAVLGILDEVIFAEGSLSAGNITYSINTNGIGNKTCRLKIVGEDNISIGYSLSNHYNNEFNLYKKQMVTKNFDDAMEITSYNLLQNYPNPFNPVTTINFQVLKPGFVSLKIYDI